MCLAAEHPSDEDLELYARERLERSKAARMSFHLESCAECRDRLAQSVIYRLDLRQHLKGDEADE
jgi:anti-sigma factor ChrR (cupin superfamily)